MSIHVQDISYLLGKYLEVEWLSSFGKKLSICQNGYSILYS